MSACSEPGRTKEGNVGVILPSSSCAWCLRSGSFETPSRVNRFLSFNPSEQYVMSHHLYHLFISLQDLPYFLYPNLYSSLLLLRSWNLTGINSCYLSWLRLTLSFSFFPLDKEPLPLREGPACFRKTVGLHIVERGMGGQPIGEFFPWFYSLLFSFFFRVFSPIRITQHFL